MSGWQRNEELLERFIETVLDEETAAAVRELYGDGLVEFCIDGEEVRVRLTEEARASLAQKV